MDANHPPKPILYFVLCVITKSEVKVISTPKAETQCGENIGAPLRPAGVILYSLSVCACGMCARTRCSQVSIHAPEVNHSTGKVIMDSQDIPEMPCKILGSKVLLLYGRYHLRSSDPAACHLEPGGI